MTRSLRRFSELDDLLLFYAVVCSSILLRGQHVYEHFCKSSMCLSYVFVFSMYCLKLPHYSSLARLVSISRWRRS